MLRHVPRDEPGIGVITAPGRRSDDNRDLLALVERRWSLGHRRAQGERRRESERCDEPADGPFGKHNPSLATIRARRRLLTIGQCWWRIFSRLQSFVDLQPPSFLPDGALPHGPGYRAHPRLYHGRTQLIGSVVCSWRKLTCEC